MAIQDITDPSPPPRIIRCEICGENLTYLRTEIDDFSESYEPDRWDEYECMACGIYSRFLYELRRPRKSAID